MTIDENHGGSEEAAMERWRVHEIAVNVRALVVREMAELPPDVDAAVERLWQRAQQRTPGLFNGRVFSADTVSPDRITGHWTEYRRIMAQARDPSLYPVLGIRPLAACGVLIGRDGIAIGRRRANAAYQPGLWQLPPAGSVDSSAARGAEADLPWQVLREMQEELGIRPESVQSVTPLCAVEHPGSHVLDLGFALRTDLTAEQLLAAHEIARDQEYEEIQVIPFAELEATLLAMGRSLVPPARVFLARAGLLSD